MTDVRRKFVPGAAATAEASGWAVADVTYRYPNATRDAVSAVSLEIPAAACTAILGPNGSGKSTLLRMLLRAIQPIEGSILLRGRPLRDWDRLEMAREIGVVTQHEHIAFPISVRELVAMGRYPHLGLLGPERHADRSAIAAALDRCDVAHLAGRRFDTLSGGERQRVRLARALAQEPRILALDEPTLALDLGHEMEIFELLRQLVLSGVTVVLVTHNLNLAARFAARLVLMHEGRLVASGAPAEVLDRRLLETVFDWPLQLLEHPGPGPDTGAIQITPLAARPRSTSESS